MMQRKLGPAAVEFILDTTRTAGGGWVRDSNGTVWKVDSFGPIGTGDQRATLGSDGRIVVTF